MSEPLMVLLTDAQLELLADKIAKRMGAPMSNKPYNLREAALALGGMSTEALRQRVHAGLIAKVPGMGKRILIPRAEIARLQEGEKGGKAP